MISCWHSSTAVMLHGLHTCTHTFADAGRMVECDAHSAAASLCSSLATGSCCCPSTGCHSLDALVNQRFDGCCTFVAQDCCHA